MAKSVFGSNDIEQKRYNYFAAQQALAQTQTQCTTYQVSSLLRNRENFKCGGGRPLDMARAVRLPGRKRFQLTICIWFGNLYSDVNWLCSLARFFFNAINFICCLFY